jgi:hypothetical protein
MELQDNYCGTTFDFETEQITGQNFCPSLNHKTTFCHKYKFSKMSN